MEEILEYSTHTCARQVKFVALSVKNYNAPGETLTPGRNGVSHSLDYIKILAEFSE